MTARSTSFDAFVSYRRIDGFVIAARLRRALTRYRLPSNVRGNRDLKPRIFLDKMYGRATTDYYERVISPALRASNHLIVVATPAASQRLSDGSRNWVERERRQMRPHPGTP
jgi:hypothetical protein